MAIRVAGVWELGWNTPIKELELWEFPLRDFKVDSFYMSPVSGIFSRHVTERNQIEDVISEYRIKQVPIVFVDEHGKVPLKSFSHPDDVLYVFGKASFSPMAAFFQEGDFSVKIETVMNGGLLWPHQAASIVLYDRYMKA